MSDKIIHDEIAQENSENSTDALLSKLQELDRQKNHALRRVHELEIELAVTRDRLRVSFFQGRF